MGEPSPELLAAAAEYRASNHAQAVEFLRQLRPGGPWVLTAIIPDESKPPTITETHTTEAAVIAFVERWDGRRNLYYTLNAVRAPTTKKPTKADIAAVEYLHADLDPRADEAPNQTIWRYLAALRNSGLPEPTAKVASGNGLQVLWRLDQPIPLDSLEVIADVEARNLALTLALGETDTSTRNVDRLLRLPGTLNLPTKAKLKKDRYTEHATLMAFGRAVCSVAAFPKNAPNGVQTAPASPKVQTTEIKRERASIDLDALPLPESTKMLIRDPNQGRDEFKSRSEAYWSLLRSTIKAGLSDDQMETILLDPGFPIGEALQQSSAPDYAARRQIAKAREAAKEWEAKHPGKSGSAPAPAPVLTFQTSAEFAAALEPGDYLIDGVVELGYFYSFTAPTGHGKTAVLIYVAFCVARGEPVCGMETSQGRVLYLCGENPVDARKRWIKQCEVFGAEPKDVDVVFLPMAAALSNDAVREQIKKKIAADGPFKLIIVDTVAAYFDGEEDSRDDQRRYALAVREFCDDGRGPSVIGATHPVKNFDPNRLLPSGGGTFLNSVDGNLAGVGAYPLIEITWHGKFRGSFEPFSFKIVEGQLNSIKDKKGRPIRTVTAQPISDAQKSSIENVAASKEIELLKVIQLHPRISLTDLALKAHWEREDGKPNRKAVENVANRLRGKGLIEASTTGVGFKLKPAGHQLLKADRREYSDDAEDASM